MPILIDLVGIENSSQSAAIWTKGYAKTDHKEKSFFTPNLKILPPGQRELWPLLAAVPASFTLYGGTALAIQLGHREWVDSTSFHRKPSIRKQLQAGLGFLHSGRIIQSSANTLSCVVCAEKSNPKSHSLEKSRPTSFHQRRRLTQHESGCHRSSPLVPAAVVKLWKGFCPQVKRSMEGNSILRWPCEHSDFSTIVKVNYLQPQSEPSCARSPPFAWIVCLHFQRAGQ